MRVGLPREVKTGEFRLALTPKGAARLIAAGHSVILETRAGLGVGIPDREYEAEGARIGEPWEADVVVKVKELQESEYRRPRPGQTVFGFQHFGPEPELLEAALESGATFVAYETVGQDDASLPILAPMSAIAGRLAVQAGAWCLQKQNGGSGVLLPGLEGVAPGRIAILGAGNVGSNALAVASGIGARVSVHARTEKRLRVLKGRYPQVEFRTDLNGVEESDLVIAGVLTPGQMSPKLLSRERLRRLRPGSALVDVGIDQGGIAETSRPTTHAEPTYVEEGVVHYCVPNMPAACARTASLALEHAVLPFLLEYLRGAVSPALATGVQVKEGRVRHQHLARDTGRPWHPL